MLTLIRSLVFLIFFSVLMPQAFPGENNAQYVSVSELVRNPEKYHKKQISVFGFSVIDTENVNIYRSEEDYLNYNIEECIAFHPSQEIFDKREAINFQYIQLSGIFNSELCQENEICNSWCNKFGISVEEINNLFLDYKGSSPFTFQAYNISLNKEIHEYENLTSFAYRILETIYNNDPDQIINYFSVSLSDEEIIKFENKKGRIYWLFFSNGSSFSNLFKNRSHIQIDFIQKTTNLIGKILPKDNFLATACFCKDESCNPSEITANHSNGLVINQSDLSSYFCLPFIKEGGLWRININILL